MYFAVCNTSSVSLLDCPHVFMRNQWSLTTLNLLLRPAYLTDNSNIHQLVQTRFTSGTNIPTPQQAATIPLEHQATHTSSSGVTQQESSRIAWRDASAPQAQPSHHKMSDPADSALLTGSGSASGISDPAVSQALQVNHGLGVAETLPRWVSFCLFSKFCGVRTQEVCLLYSSMDSPH